MLADAFLEGVRRHDSEYQRFQVAPSVLKEASEVIQAKSSEAKGIVDRSDLMWSPQAMEAAVGKEGEEGDPEAIAELAARWVDFYEDMLAWAVELRDRDVPPPIHLLYLILALMVARPLRECGNRGAVRPRRARRRNRGSALVASQEPWLRC